MHFKKKYFQRVGKFFLIFLIQGVLGHQILSSSVHHESKEAKLCGHSGSLQVEAQHCSSSHLHSFMFDTFSFFMSLNFSFILKKNDLHSEQFCRLNFHRQSTSIELFPQDSGFLLEEVLLSDHASDLGRQFTISG